MTDRFRYMTARFNASDYSASTSESRCLLLGLEVLSNRRKIAAALFVRAIICRRIESAYLTDLLSFESNPYPRRRNARLIDFNHHTMGKMSL
jgi:hypothetical protein